MEVVSTSLDQTVDLGRRLGQLAEPGDVIAIDGELGAGKTQLVRGLAMGMNLDPVQVSSPTFVIMHEYLPPPPEDLPSATLTPLVHIDAYRLTGPDDLASVGFDDELGGDAVVAVEWAGRLESFARAALGENRLHILIEHAGNDARRLTLTPHGRWTDRLSRLNPL